MYWYWVILGCFRIIGIDIVKALSQNWYSTVVWPNESLVLGIVRAFTDIFGIGVKKSGFAHVCYIRFMGSPWIDLGEPKHLLTKIWHYHRLESSSSSISSLFKNVVKQQHRSHCCHRLFDAVGRTLPSGLPVPIFYSSHYWQRMLSQLLILADC